MASEDVAIRVDGVSKDFLLPHERTQSVKTAFINALKGKRNKTTHKQHALKDVSFEVKKGEFFGIVGRNGSGKSTMLKILAQIYQPTKGSVQVNGRLVPFIELGVGFNPELSGRDNVYLSASLIGFSKPEIDSMYNDIVEFAELEKFMDQKLKNYSSGMQVRLAFSVAVRADADILLIDEVLAVGDADFQRKCFQYFKSLKRTSKTIVFVSHDMSAVREFCDQAILIDDGRIAISDTSAKVASSYHRLFMAMDKTKSALEYTNRWGTQAATTKSIHSVVQTAEVEITQTIEATEQITDAVAGLRIRDESGTDVAGTNTQLEGLKIDQISPKEKLQITWKFPNVLADGKYVVDPSVTSTTGETHDWWDEASIFEVKKDRHLPYPIDPSYKVVLKKLPARQAK